MAQLDARSRLPRAVLRLGLARPRSVLLVWACVGALAAVGVGRLEIETSTDSVLDRGAEAWSFYQESQARFGGDEILTILIEGDEPFDPEILAEVLQLTDTFQGYPGVWRVDSLATVPLVHATPRGDLSLDAALSDGLPQTHGQELAFKSRVRADRIAPRNLISDDGRAVAVNLVLEQGAEARYEAVLREVDRALEGRSAWVSGVPIFRTAADSRTRDELLLFVPMTVAMVGALLYLLFGSLRSVVIPLVSSGLGTWVVLGAMGALAVPLTISTVLLPSILLALGCAYTMHLLTVAAGRGRGEELRRALSDVALPVALSGLTTAVGFVAVSFVRIETIQYIGAFGAIGVLVVLAATLTITPAALRLWPLQERRLRFRRWFCGPAARGVVAFAAEKRPVIIAGWVLALLGIGVGIFRIHVETDVIVWFSRKDPIRVAYEEIRSRLSGISPMNVVIEAPEGRSVSTPDVLRAIDDLSNHLESLSDVGRAVSIADPLRQLHGGFVGDPDNPLPQALDLINQYLLLLGAKDYTYDLITADRSSANVRLRVNNNGSKALLRIAEGAHAWWADHGIAGYVARTTGIMYEFARAEDEIAAGQLRGLGFALIAIAVILLVIFRSPSLGAIALLPNAIPIAMAFGVMGLLAIPLDAGTVVLGNLALGIAVDDTIHVVTGFHSRREGGLGVRSALMGAFERSLAPVVYTTLAVSIGFAILGLSEFTFTRHLGLLTAGIMGLCLLGNLLLLPALLLGLGPRRDEDAADGGQRL